MVLTVRNLQAVSGKAFDVGNWPRRDAHSNLGLKEGVYLVDYLTDWKSTSSLV